MSGTPNPVESQGARGRGGSKWCAGHRIQDDLYSPPQLEGGSQNPECWGLHQRDLEEEVWGGDLRTLKRCRSHRCESVCILRQRQGQARARTHTHTQTHARAPHPPLRSHLRRRWTTRDVWKEGSGTAAHYLYFIVTLKPPPKEKLKPPSRNIQSRDPRISFRRMRGLLPAAAGDDKAPLSKDSS